MSDVDQIDELLMARVQPRWQKAAMIIGTTMIEAKEELVGIDDFFLAARIQQLAKAGKIESRSDLNHIRYSEIRSVKASPSKL
ncbi:MAG: DUF3658 domain-containing protein [Dokdonella sp.]